MSTDENLRDALHHLDTAIHRLTGVRTTIHDGRTLTAPCLYVQMQQAVHESKRGVSPGAFNSSAPAWLETIDWITTVDTTVRAWATPEQGHILSLLAGLAHRPWRPQDTGQARQITNTIHGWVRAAETILAGGPRMEVREPCPECGERYVYRRDGLGETIRADVLHIDAEGCHCAVCGTHWPPDQLAFLARLIGAPDVTEQSGA
ncbi:hypothetical protein G4X40_18620 [Rhodococcus sp. D2-41]|uniref:DUF7341 domain-containing protein n=1 Tax=Speluncibacter jeojiensis TaxID=2710754 RepID=UPI00240E9DE2|nr:hypothetical protein [Rhodococcus sp. D2-41]MDG3012160.1 hypothetical protein [Rhodococcus sp. D2-41]